MSEALNEANVGEKDIRPIEDREVLHFPASSSQRHLWFLMQLDPRNAAYNIPSAYRIRGDLDVALLEKSINAVVARHETFRTVFANEEGVPVQVILPDLKVVVERETLAEPATLTEETLTDRVRAFSAALFRLDEGPLFRAKVVELGDADALLLFNFHHTIVDAIAMDLFAAELNRVYSAYALGSSPNLAEPELQYADYTVWQKEFIASDEFREQLGVFVELLSGYRCNLELPKDFPRGDRRHFSGEEIWFRLPKTLSERVAEFSRTQSVSLFVTLLAAYQVALSTLSGQSDIIIGTPFANREEEDLASILGNFIHTLPIPATIDSSRPFAALIKEVRRVLIQVQQHQAVPLDAIVEAVKPPREGIYFPLIQHGFTLQEPPMTLALGELGVERLHAHNGGTRFDTFNFMWNTPEGLEGYFEYNSDIYLRSTAERVLRTYLAVLEACVSRPELALSEALAQAEDTGSALNIIGLASGMRGTKAAEDDAFWAPRLKNFEATPLPFVQVLGQAQPVERHTLEVPLRQQAKTKSGDGSEPLLLSLALLYLARIANSFEVSVPFQTQRVRNLLASNPRLFMPWVPIRNAFDPAATFDLFAAAVADHLGEGSGHDAPSAKLAERSGISVPESPRDIPTFPVAILECDDPGERVEDQAWVSDCALAIVIARDGAMRWSYHPGWLSDAAANRMVEQFATLYESVLRDATLAVSDHSIIGRTDAELLAAVNATEVAYDPRCIQELFEAQVERTPNAIALCCGEISLTYAEVNERANRLARLLREKGAKPGELVGIMMSRSADMVVAMLATLKSGAGYVPLDPDYPADRIRFMAQDADVKCLATTRRCLEAIGSFDLPTVLVEEAIAGVDHETRSLPFAATSLTDTAYVIYTSGSTGKPKGVVVAHANVANFVVAMDKLVGYEPPGTWLAVSSISFDISVLELLWTLARGFKVVVYAEPRLTLGHSATLGHGETIPGLIQKHAVTHFQCTPSQAFMLTVDDEARRALAQLKFMIVGGEAVSMDLARSLVEAVGGRVINGYGPTEATIYSVAHEVDSRLPYVPIGKPVANTLVYVADDRLQLLPPGVPGELLLGGKSVVRGYLNRPELTAERFIGVNNLEAANDPVYRTGDLVRVGFDGNVAYLGRIDFQVKIRGYRIELGEIESVLREGAGVKDAVAVAREDEPGNQQLVAYIIPVGGGDFDETGLRDHLARKLPDFMRPSAYVLVDEWPKTPSGKIDRKALPKPVTYVNQDRAKEYVAPKPGLQTTIHDIWREILGLDTISVRDSFFDLGGHSLLAVRLFSKINKATGKNLPLATLFTSPTIEQLAVTFGGGAAREATKPIDSATAAGAETSAGALPLPILKGKGPVDPWASIVPIKPDGERSPFFCVHGMGGNVLNYRQLAPYLDADQPLYGLQCRGLDGLTEPFADLETMVRHYVDEIRKVQPDGPYLLGGGSMGGYVAFEMARALLAQGERTALLALFDTFGPSYVDLTSSGVHDAFRTRTLRGLIDRGREKFREVSPAEFLTSVVKRFLGWGRTLYRLLLCSSYRTIGRAIPHQLRYWFIERRNLRLLFSHKAGVYSGPVTLFRCPIESEGMYRDPYLGWKNHVVGEFIIEEIPGATHDDFIERPETGKRLQDHLIRLQAVIDKDRHSTWAAAETNTSGPTTVRSRR